MTARYSNTLNSQYNQSIPTLANGDYSPLQVDQYSRLLVSVQELPVGVATAQLQIDANALLSNIRDELSNNISVLGPLTNVQLRAAPVSVLGPLTDAQLRIAPISVSGTFWQNTQPVSLSTIPIAPGAATSVLQGVANTSLASIDTKTPTLVSGRQPVDGSGVTQPISAASMPLPPDASTATNQGIANIYLSGAATAANQVLNGTASQTTLTVALTAVPMRVGAANLANRKSIILQPNAAGYSYGYSAALQPFALTNGTPVQLNLGPNITIWAIKSSGTNTIAVVELS